MRSKAKGPSLDRRRVMAAQLAEDRRLRYVGRQRFRIKPPTPEPTRSERRRYITLARECLEKAARCKASEKTAVFLAVLRREFDCGFQSIHWEFLRTEINILRDEQ